MLLNSFRWNLLFYKGIRQGFQHANTRRTNYCIASISNRPTWWVQPQIIPKKVPMTRTQLFRSI